MKKIAFSTSAFFYFFLGLLIFFWSIKGVIAIRHLSLFCLSLCTAWFCYEHEYDTSDKFIFKIDCVSLKYPFYCLFALIIWFFIQIYFFSYEIQWSLNEWKSQWGIGLVVGGIGWIVGRIALKREVFSPQKIANFFIAIIIFFAFCGIISWVSLALQTHTLPFGQIPLVEWKGTHQSGKLEFSYMLTIGLAFLSVEILHFFLKRPRLLNFPISWTISAGFILLTALFLAAARNAFLGMAFLIISSYLIWIFSFDNKRSAFYVSLALITTLASFIFLFIQIDSRWHDLAETIPIAMDIEHHTAWFTRNEKELPLLSNGNPVNDSNYQRIAWITAGIKLLFEHYPLGYGFGREVFAHAVEPIYGGRGGGHSHSGYVDLGLSAGFPGIILWLCYTFSLLKIGLDTYKKTHLPYALLLFFLVAGYNGRLLLDSVGRDHFLQIHFFLSALILGWLANHEKISHHSAR